MPQSLSNVAIINPNLVLDRHGLPTDDIKMVGVWHLLKVPGHLDAEHCCLRVKTTDLITVLAEFGLSVASYWHKEFCLRQISELKVPLEATNCPAVAASSCEFQW